jgi:hypothetical protein
MIQNDGFVGRLLEDASKGQPEGLGLQNLDWILNKFEQPVQIPLQDLIFVSVSWLEIRRWIQRVGLEVIQPHAIRGQSTCGWVKISSPKVEARTVDIWGPCIFTLVTSSHSQGLMGHFTLYFPSFLPPLVLGTTLSSPSPSNDGRSHLSLRLMWRCWKPLTKGALRFVACDSQTFWLKILRISSYIQTYHIHIYILYIIYIYICSGWCF